MTVHLKPRFKFCRRYKSDIWSKIYIRRKRVKFIKLNVRRPRTNISIGNFKGVMPKKTKYIKRRRRSRYGKNLAKRQRILKFYAALKEYQFKKYLTQNKKIIKNLFKNTIANIETRLDIMLYRSHLVKSVLMSRFNIIHKKVTVNNKIISMPGYILKKGDVVSAESPLKLWRKLKRTRFIWGYPSEHLYVNWRTLKFGVHKKPDQERLNYTFKLSSRRILEFYRT
jgi:ribosomal protein S4